MDSIKTIHAVEAKLFRFDVAVLLLREIGAISLAGSDLRGL